MSVTVPATLPQNVAFEQQILGAAITAAGALDTVMGGLRSEHFYSDINRVIFDTIATRYQASESIDGSLLARALTRTHSEAHLPDQFDAHAYVASLIQARCPEAAVGDRIRDIVACAHARQMYQAAQEMAASALETDGDPQQVESALLATTDAIGGLTDAMVEQPWDTLDEVLVEAASDDGRAPLFKSGLVDLDRKLNGGFRAGQMVVIAGRPAQGKSTLALDFARQASVVEGVPGLVISQEMSTSEVGSRFLSAQAAVDLSHMMKMTLTPPESDRVDKAIKDASGTPLYVVTPDEAHWPTLRSMIVAAHRRLGIKYVVLDYLQLINSSGGPANMSREQVIATVSRGLKIVANSLGIVAFAVAQLNRGPESRTGGKPQLSDLRESGQVEQDADVAILIHQPATYDPDTERVGEADLVIAKHRNGATGTVPVAFQGHYSRFASMAQDVEPGM